MSLISDPASVLEDITQLFNRDRVALENPYPIYQRMREQQPVLRVGPMIAVSRYDDCRAVLDDPHTYSSVRGAGSRISARMEQLDEERQAKLRDFVDFESGWLVQVDEPFHTELRGAVRHAFTPRRINEMADEIQGIIDDLLKAADERGSLNLIEEFAYPLPLLVICSMLGAGVEDARSIREWSDAIAEAISTEYSNIDDAHAAIEGFRGLIGGYIADRRTRGDYSGLLGALLQPPADTQPLTEKQIVEMCALLLFAGHETTTNLIANAVLTLLDYPEEAEKLRQDPALMKPAVEEFLRFSTSVQAVHRVATVDTEIAGVPVSKGDTIRVMLASANRDSSMFDNAESFVLDRPNARRHLGMGFGIHSCLGIWLAKLETQLAVSTLVTRYPQMRLAGEVRRRPNYTLYGPEEVPLTLR